MSPATFCAASWSRLVDRCVEIVTWGDIQWHTTPTTQPDDLYATTTEIRDVASVEPQSGITVGESVRVFGRSSNVRGSDTASPAPPAQTSFSRPVAGSWLAASGLGEIA